MADLAQLEAALVKADAAGNSDDAKAFAAEIRRMRSAQPEQPKEPQTTIGQDIAQGLGNIGAGLVRGAGSIGSTILAPYDIAKDALAGKGLSLESNRARRADIDYGLERVGAQPESMLYQGGKLAGEIAGTAGTGGLLAKGAQAAGAAPALVNSLATGGFRTGAAPGIGNMLTRIAGGAATGGASAGLVNPEQAGAGALIGGALPPLVSGAALLGKGARSVATNALGATTGTSPETISTAFQSGKTGSKAFLENMRGKTDFNDVVDAAKSGLDKMRLDRGNQYRSGMVDIAKDKSVLDFAPVDKAMNSVKQLGSYKGVQTNSHASGVVDEIAEKVAQWKALDPAEYHTPEGFDALKRAIGDIRDSTQFGTPARKAADSVYNAVKSEISAQAPVYSDVMKGYAKATDELEQIQKALSLGDKTSKDTAIRKLQSLMRNNAQSNYGNRLSLAKQLEEKGGVELTPSIAGQAMNTVLPRGMTGAIEKAAIPAAAFFSPQALLMAPLASPRLVGESLYGAGRATNALGNRLGSVQNAIGANANPQIANALARTIPTVSLTNPSARQ